VGMLIALLYSRIIPFNSTPPYFVHLGQWFPKRTGRSQGIYDWFPGDPWIHFFSVKATLKFICLINLKEYCFFLNNRGIVLTGDVFISYDL
jgi:hypothetical protein